MLKKLILMLAAFVLLLTMVPMSAFADESEDPHADAEVIAAGDSKTVSCPANQEMVYFQFVPEADGVYAVESSTPSGSKVDPACEISIWDDEYKEYEDYKKFDDRDDDRNFIGCIEAKAGRKYLISVYTYDEAGTFTLKLTRSKIQKIEFTPIQPYEFKEMRGGYWDWDYDDNMFYYYRMPSYQDNDTLTVYTDDGSVEYKYDSEREAFISEEGNIDDGDIICSDNQSRSPWKAGNECAFELDYKGVVCNVPVTIIPTDVTGIKYTPKKAYKYIQNDPESGQWEKADNGKKMYYYYMPGYSNGDKLTLTLKDGSEKVYVFDWDEDSFVADDGDMIYGDDNVWFSSTQYQSPWTPSRKNYVTVMAFGYSVKLPVTIVPKKANTMKAKAKTVRVKYRKLKKKTVTVKKIKAFTIKNAKGTVTFKLTKKDKKAKNKIRISKKGKITVKKGLKKGTYRIRVRVRAAGNKYYKPLAKILKVTIKVR